MTLRYLISPEERRKKLRRLLESKRLIRGMEVHNAISALVINDLSVEINRGENKKTNEFDFFWASSLTDSASKGHPDIEIISLDSRLKTINEILEVTNKPIVVDGDTGGDIHHFEYLVPKLEKMGVSAVVIEDKVFPKRNSLIDGTIQEQEEPEKFAEKIKCGKQIQTSDDFMIIARIESLIAGKEVEDALIRAGKYLEAGVDAILIHSKSTDPEKIFRFASEYSRLCQDLNVKRALVCIPTTYNSVYESELQEKGFNIVIYANHMLRAAYKSMQDVGKIILENERALEADPHVAPLIDIFDKVGFLDIREKDELLSTKPSIIIPAAGETVELKPIIGELPKALIKINEKTILEHQISLFKKFGLNDINVIIGYQKNKFNIPKVNYIENLEYNSTGILHSLMKAKEKMSRGFIYVMSDLLIDEKLIKELLERKDDIILVVDSSYLYHKHEIDKKLDAVVTRKGKQGKQPSYQKLRKLDDEVILIGKNISKETMTHEFVGIAKFSKQGAENLIKVYEDIQENNQGSFHEAESLEKAMDIDMFQELIRRGFKISVLETNGGWIEIHNEKDINYAKEILRY